MESNTRKNIKYGSILAFISFFASIITYIFFTPFLLKHVGDNQYGIYSFALSITTWFTFALSSITSGYNRFYSAGTIGKEKYDGKTVNSSYFVIFIIYGFLILIASGIFLALMMTNVIPLNGYTADEKNLIYLLFAFTIIGILISLVFQIFKMNLTYNSKFIWIHGCTILTTILKCTLPIPFLLSGSSILIVAIVALLANTFALIIDFFYDYFILKIKFSFKNIIADKSLFKQILVFTAILLLDEFATKISLNINAMALGFKAYTIENAHYLLGSQIVPYATGAVILIAKTFSPTVNDNETLKCHDKNVALFQKVSFIQMSIWMLMVGGFIAFGKDFVKLWLGSGYDDVYWICGVLLVLKTVPVCSILTQDIEWACGKHLGRSIIYVISASIHALIVFILISLLPREMSIILCLVGTTFSILVFDWVVLPIYHKKTIGAPMGLFYIDILKFILILLPLVSLALIFNVLIASPILSFFIKALIFSLLYILIMMLVFPKQMKTVFAFFKRKK
ncbi:MAG: hypothetical protein WC366_04270 [Bacilli bacterium]|jgi:O-antigen/teichoic acid export membrane protein